MASKAVNTDLDLLGTGRLQNLAAANAAGQAVEYNQWLAQIAGLAWKDDVRAAATANVNLSSPGTSIDGVTLAVGDAFFTGVQTNAYDNGVYIFNGSSVAASRRNDLSHSTDFNAAVVSVDPGGTSNGLTRWRCTTANPTIGTTNIVWVNDQPAAPAASETTAGVVQIATQAQTDAGSDNSTAITPLKLANYAGRAKRYSTTIGDGTSTSINVTHNLNTEDVVTFVREATGAKRQYDCQIVDNGVNGVTLNFNSAPASNSLRVTCVA